MAQPQLRRKQTTPRQKRSNETRGKLLAAAIDSFSDNGYEGSSIRKIAEKAGISFQLITYHFGSKEDLWLAVVHEIFSQARYKMAEYFEGIRNGAPEDRRELFRDYLHMFFRRNIIRPQFRRIYTYESMADSARYHNVLKPVMRDLIDEYSRHIHMLIDLGVITKFSAEEVMMLLPAVAESNALMSYEFELMSGMDIDSQEFIDWQVDTMMKILIDRE